MAIGTDSSARSLASPFLASAYLRYYSVGHLGELVEVATLRPPAIGWPEYVHLAFAACCPTSSRLPRAVSAAQLLELRQLIAERFPDARPLRERDAHRLAEPVATGIAALDRVLLSGGLPRGKLTVWAPAVGAAAVLRATCRAVIAHGERAAWIDASRTRTLGWATGRSVARESAPGARITSPRHQYDPSAGTPLLVHPPDRVAALRATALLLRSGAFALVVLDGAESVGNETVHLTRAAREGAAAFVAITTRTAMAALRVSSRLDVQGIRWEYGPFGNPAAPRAIQAEIRARSLGWNARAVVSFSVASYELRDALEPGAADRRGARPPANDG